MRAALPSALFACSFWPNKYSGFAQNLYFSISGIGSDIVVMGTISLELFRKSSFQITLEEIEPPRDDGEPMRRQPLYI